MRSAQSGDCVLPPAGARRCKANHRGIGGEHRAQFAPVRREREERTFIERRSCSPLNESGLRMVNWESPPKTPLRIRKTDTFVVFHLFVLHSVKCRKTCHFTACLWSLWNLFLFSMLILHMMSSWVCSYLLNIYYFTYAFPHAHTEAQTHKHTRIISTPEELWLPDTGAWLGRAKERLLLEAKALHAHKKGGEKCQENSDIHKS